MKSRHAELTIIYEGTNISVEIGQDVENFSFTDNASGSADDMTLDVNNQTRKWLNTWRPMEGDKIIVTITMDDKKLECGMFYVDDIGFNFPPAILSINAVSTPIASDFIHAKRSDSFTDTSIKSIIGQIADRNGMKLVYDATSNPVLAYTQQDNQSDSEFVANLCGRWGLSTKVFNQSLIIFEESLYEKRQPIQILTLESFSSLSCQSKQADCAYDGVRVSYSGGTYSFQVPGKNGNNLLILDEEVTSFQEAEAIGKSKLREKNREGMLLSGTVMGNPHLIACTTVKVEGLGFFDGIYYIDKAAHSINPYTTSLEMHRILEGY